MTTFYVRMRGHRLVPGKLLLFCLALALGQSVGGVFAQTIRYVSSTGTNSNLASATSWASATTNLQGAINASATGGQVWVKAGTYKPTTTTGPGSRTVSFSMKNGVGIYGGFVGTETSLSSRHPITLTSPSSTTLSGDIGTLGTTSDNSYHIIFNATGLDNSAVLDGFVIKGANANGGGIHNYGGGIYNNGNESNRSYSPLIRNCVFQSNTATTSGGAIYNDARSAGSSSPTLAKCSFQSNSAASGGAIYNNASNFGGSSPTLTNCSFQGNAATTGGAIYNDGSSFGTSNPVLTNCSFQGNSATSGGVMCNNATSGTSDPTLTNCVLFGNGGANTFANKGATVKALYSLFERSVSGYTTSPTNLTTTISPFFSPNSTALRSGSPAINTGNPSTTTAMVGTTDLAGNPRFFNSGRIDMGAFEFQGSPTLVNSVAGDDQLPTPSTGRLGVAEPTTGLNIVVLGNPVTGQDMTVNVMGAEGQPLRLYLTDITGRTVSERSVEQAGAIEHQTLSLGQQPAGVMLLRVSTPTQSQTVKVLKTD